MTTQRLFSVRNACAWRPKPSEHCCKRGVSSLNAVLAGERHGFLWEARTPHPIQFPPAKFRRDYPINRSSRLSFFTAYSAAANMARMKPTKPQDRALLSREAMRS